MNKNSEKPTTIEELNRLRREFYAARSTWYATNGQDGGALWTKLETEFRDCWQRLEQIGCYPVVDPAGGFRRAAQ